MSNRIEMGPGFVMPDPTHKGKHALIIYDIAADEFRVFRGMTADGGEAKEGTEPAPSCGDPKTDDSPARRWRFRRDAAILILHLHGLSSRFIADVFDLPRSRVEEIVRGMREYATQEEQADA